MPQTATRQPATRAFVAAARRLRADGVPGVALLHSGLDLDGLGAFSFLMARPLATAVAEPGHPLRLLHGPAEVGRGLSDDPLTAAAQVVERLRPATPVDAQGFPFAGGVIPAPVLGERVLGAHVSFADRQVTGCHNERLQRATARARRVRWLPLRPEQRSEIIAAAVIPQGLHAGAATRLPKRQTMPFRTACAAAGWGVGRHRRCAEMQAVFIIKGHRADPHMALTFQRMQQLRPWESDLPAQCSSEGRRRRRDGLGWRRCKSHSG